MAIRDTRHRKYAGRRTLRARVGFAALTLIGSTLVSFSALPAAIATPPTPGTTVPIAPARLLDSRSGVGTSAGAVAPHAIVSLQVTGRGGVPASGVAAVTLNVTVTGPTNAGYVTVWGSGGPTPATSNVNFTANQTLANLVITGVGSDGKVNLLNGSDGPVQLIADVSSYVNSGSATASGTLTTIAPARLLDTRSGIGATAGSIASFRFSSVAVHGVAGIPSTGVSAVLLNLTVTEPEAPGYIVAEQDKVYAVNTSNVNFGAGQTVANFVLAPVGPDGTIQLLNASEGRTHLVADVFGYVLGGTTTTPGTISPVFPNRLLDTRSGLGAAQVQVQPSGSVAIQVAGSTGVPATGVAAAILNVTVTNPRKAGYITAWDGTTQPGTSNLNFLAGQTVPNVVVAPVGVNGKVNLFNGSAGPADLIADIVGYVVGVPDATAPAAPTALTASAVETSTTLSWTNPTDSDFAGSTLRRNTGAVPPTSATDGTAVAELSSTTTTYTDSGLSSGTQYSYALFAHDYVPNYSAPATAGALTLSWHPAVRAAASPHGGANDISCVSATFCMAVDSLGNAQSFNGTSWGPRTLIDPLVPVMAVSCATTTFCMAIDEQNNILQYSGGGWHSPLSIDTNTLDTFTSISCTSPTFCLVGAEAASAERSVFQYNGSSWQSLVIPSPQMQAIDSISCVSSTFCAALSFTGWTAVYNGTAWSSPQRTGVAGGGFVACASPTFCVAAGGTDATFDGTTWTVGPALSSPTDGLACPTTNRCVRTGDGSAQIFDGTTWNSDVTIDARGVGHVACFSATGCLAVTVRGESYSFNGTSWSGPTVFNAAGGGLQAISCPTAGHCKAVDAYSGVTSLDGSWGATTVIDPSLVPVQPRVAAAASEASISCPTVAFCELSTSSGKYSTYTGTTWSAPKTVTPAGHASCSSPTFCLQVGGSGAAAAFDGSNWSGAPSASTSLLGVSCASPTFCAAESAAMSAVIYSGGTWGVAQPLGIGAINSISCPVSGFCVAAGSGASVAVYQNGTWSQPTTLFFPSTSGLGVRSVSCVSTTFCVAVSSHYAYVYDGTQWSPQEAIALSAGVLLLTAVSCASARYCTAVDYGGMSYTLS